MIWKLYKILFDSQRFASCNIYYMYLKTYASMECSKQTSTLQTFAFIMNWMKYHVVSSFVTYGSFYCVSTRHQKLKKNNNPKLFFCCSIYSLQHYAHHRKTHCCAFCQLRKLFFRWFYMKAHHWLWTTEIISPFAQNGTSYSVVALYEVKRQHCYCTPCSVCKREKFDQFNISLNYVYKYPVSIRYCYHN